VDFPARLVFYDFEREAFVLFGSGGSQEGADGFGGAALATDNFAEVFGVYAQSYHCYRRAVGFDTHFVRAVDKSTGDDVYEVFHPKARLRNESLPTRAEYAYSGKSGVKPFDTQGKPPHSKEKLGMKKRPG
jgi:hypothetical protein